MRDISPESDIIMTGYTALSKTAYLADAYRNKLEDYLPENIIKRACMHSAGCFMSYDEIAAIPDRNLYNKIYTIGYGGIYKALWDVAEDINCGIRVYLKDISIKQETVEICNILDINPYMLDGTGSYLFVAEHGSSLLRSLEAAGVHAAVIGYTTADNDRVVINNDEVKYLSFRVTDELERYESDNR